MMTVDEMKCIRCGAPRDKGKKNSYCHNCRKEMGREYYAMKKKGERRRMLYAAVDLTPAENVLYSGTVKEVADWAGVEESIVVNSIVRNLSGKRRGYKFVKTGREIIND